LRNNERTLSGFGKKDYINKEKAFNSYGKEYLQELTDEFYP